ARGCGEGRYTTRSRSSPRYREGGLLQIDLVRVHRERHEFRKCAGVVLVQPTLPERAEARRQTELPEPRDPACEHLVVEHVRAIKLGRHFEQVQYLTHVIAVRMERGGIAGRRLATVERSDQVDVVGLEPKQVDRGELQALVNLAARDLTVAPLLDADAIQDGPYAADQHADFGQGPD